MSSLLMAVASQGGEPGMKWTYIGTASTPFDGTYTVTGSADTGCPTQSFVSGRLNQFRDPNNYAEGFIMRVTVQETICDPFFGCSTHHCRYERYRADVDN